MGIGPNTLGEGRYTTIIEQLALEILRLTSTRFLQPGENGRAMKDFSDYRALWSGKGSFKAGEGTIVSLADDLEHAVIQVDGTQDQITVDLWAFAPSELAEEDRLTVGDHVSFGDDGVGGLLADSSISHWMVLDG